mmetsp:Transcript_29282/g.90996  ORF Transcript_29282/g.90996 Transcript_29282/m.90996 type:complete len:219 (+) Transcript_29282:927-1583(+)
MLSGCPAAESRALSVSPGARTSPRVFSWRNLSHTSLLAAVSMGKKDSVEGIHTMYSGLFWYSWTFAKNSSWVFSMCQSRAKSTVMFESWWSRSICANCLLMVSFQPWDVTVLSEKRTIFCTVGLTLRIIRTTARPCGSCKCIVMFTGRALSYRSAQLAHAISSPTSQAPHAADDPASTKKRAPAHVPSGRYSRHLSRKIRLTSPLMPEPTYWVPEHSW